MNLRIAVDFDNIDSPRDDADEPLSPVHRRPKDDKEPTPHQSQKTNEYRRFFGCNGHALLAHLSGEAGVDDSSLKLKTISSDEAYNANLDTSCCLLNPRRARQVLQRDLCQTYNMPESAAAELVWRPSPVSPRHPVLLSAHVMLLSEMLPSQVSRALGSDSVEAFPDTTELRMQPPISVTVALEQDQKLLLVRRMLRVFGLTNDEISVLVSFFCVSYCCKLVNADTKCEDVCFVNIHVSDEND